MSYPQQCEFCNQTIEQPDDVEFHGVGDCVDMCPCLTKGLGEDPQCLKCGGAGWLPGH